MPSTIVFSRGLSLPVAVVVPCVAFIGGIMELMLVSWQMRFSVGMDEADAPLKLLHASIFDIYKVIESLVCCLKGM